MANELDYFPFFLRRFTADKHVQSMDGVAVGAYMLLLIIAWDESPVGSIPDDDAQLQRWSRLSPEMWEKVRSPVRSCWEARDDGRLHQKRMQAVYREVIADIRKRSRAGKIAARARHGRGGSAMRSHDPPDDMRSQDGRLLLNETKENKTKRKKTTTSSALDSPEAGDEKNSAWGDQLDAQIREFFGADSTPVWDLKSHQKCRELVEIVGWERARELIWQAVREQKPFPAGWALGVVKNEISAGSGVRKSRQEQADEAASAAVNDVFGQSEKPHGE
jgi:uncharacterized protein YdaU (DUF1376 family)